MSFFGEIGNYALDVGHFFYSGIPEGHPSAPAPVAAAPAGPGALAPEAAAKMTDEEKAKAALKGLKVVEGGGAHKANEVSQEEFDRMAAMYQNLLGDKTNVTFDTSGLGEKDAGAFKDKALGDIATMMSTPAGRELLNSVVTADKDGKDTSSALRIAFAHNAAVGSNANREWDQSANGGMGAYKADGSTFIEYQPGLEKEKYGMKFNGAQTLFHEMTHVLHHRIDEPGIQQLAAAQANPVAGSRDSDPMLGAVSQEEYRTVGLKRDGDKTAPAPTMLNGVEISERNFRKQMAETGIDIGDRTSYNGMESPCMEGSCGHSGH